VKSIPRAAVRSVSAVAITGDVAETLDIQAAAPDGSTIGRIKRLHSHVAIGLHRTVQGRIQSIERDFAQPERISSTDLLVALPVAADLTEAHSGLARLQAPTGNATEVALRFTPFGLAPMTVTAVVPAIQENGR